MCDEAANVVEELLGRLGTLKLNNATKHRRWESVQIAVRSLWKEKEIKTLSKRLTTLGEAVGIVVT